MKIKKVQSVCLILACVAATGLIGCGKTDETSKKHEAITFMAPYLEVDSFIEEVHKTYPEVNLEVITYSGSNTTTYLQNMLEADDLPDICTQTFYKPDVVDVSDKTVSYTHLDVYKRQDQVRAELSFHTDHLRCCKRSHQKQ